ncbi:MAG: sialidase family protein [bacterium]|nr:sialidase family protein [bacterium]
MIKEKLEASQKRSEAWRVEVLNDETAGKGLVPAYKCLFTIKNYWPYGNFYPQECCELPGKLFVARASGKEGRRDVFLTACFPDMGNKNLYNIKDGNLFVAWRVRSPEEKVEGGKFSFVHPHEGSWQVWCNIDEDGGVIWTIRILKEGNWQNHQLKSGVLKEKKEPSFDPRVQVDTKILENWIDIQLMLEHRKLTIKINHKTEACFEHDPYPKKFYIQFGSVQENPGGEEVASEYRYIYVDDVPYLYSPEGVEDGPEDIRQEDDVLNYEVCPATLQNPRQGEGDLIQLKDGNLLLVWSDFYMGRARDWSPARVSAKISKDGGRTWGKPWVAVHRDEKVPLPTPSVKLIYARNGDLLMAYNDKIGDGDTTSGSVLRRSKDNGRTWEESVPMTKETKILFGAQNARFRILRSGRIILSGKYSENKVRWPCAIYSDDDGFTWKVGTHVPDPGLSPRLKALQNLNEPSIAELADGRLLMTMRSIAGGQFFSYSSDGGESWTKPYLSPLKGCCGPAQIRRIPGTKDILAVWNYGTGDRTPLTSAISSDGGKTWKHLKLVEKSKYYSHDYPTITFVDDKAYLTYFIIPLLPSLEKFELDASTHGLKLTVLPISWFYRNL